MADEQIVGRAVIELRAENAKLRKDLEDARAGISASMSNIERDQAKVSRSIQAELDKLNATQATAKLQILDQAVTKLGGTAKLSVAQFGQVTKELERLAATGAKVPQGLKGILAIAENNKKLQAAAVAATQAMQAEAQAMSRLHAEALQMNRAFDSIKKTNAFANLKIDKAHDEALRLNAAFDKSRSSAGKLGAVFTSLGTGGGISGALAAIGPAGLAASAGIGAIAIAGGKAFGAIKDLASQAEQWTNIAKSTGLGAPVVQQLSSFLEDAGIPAEALKKGMKELQSEIATGGAELAKFGISVADIKDLSPEEQLRAMASTIANIEDPAIRAAAATAAFGKAGYELIPALDGVASGADKMFSQFSDAEIARLAEADAAFDRLDRTWKRLSGTAAIVGLSIADAFASGSIGPVPVFTPGGGLGGVGRNRQPPGAPRDDSGDLAFWKEQERQMAAARAADEAGAKERKADGKREAAEAKQVANERQRAIEKEKKAREDLASELLKSDKALSKSAEDYWAHQVDLASKATERILADAILRSGIDPSQINAQGERVNIVSQSAIEAARRRASTALGGSGQILSDIKDEGLPTGFFTRDADIARELGVRVGQATGSLTAAKKEAFDFSGALRDAGAAAQALGINMDSSLGRMVVGLEQAAAAGQRVASAITQAGGSFKSLSTGGKIGVGLEGLGVAGSILGGGGGAKGAASGALKGAAFGTAIAPGIGTAIGAVAGGILGLFGKAPEWKKAAKDAAKILGHDVPQDMAEAILAESKKTGKSVAEVTRKIQADEAKAAAAEQRRNLEEGLAVFQSGFESATAALSDLDKSPELQAALGAIGGKLDSALGAAGLFRVPDALKESKVFSGAQAGAAGIAQALGGARQAGVVDTGLLAAAGTVASELQKTAAAEAVAQGLSDADAQKAGFGAVSQLLREQLNAELQSSGQVSAALQAQLAEAKANGLEILADPAIQSLGVQKQQLDVLQKGFGVMAVASDRGGVGAAGIVPGAVSTSGDGGFLDTVLRPTLDRLATGIDKFNPGELAASRFGALPQGDGAAADIVNAIGGLNRPDFAVTSAPQISLVVQGSADERTIQAAMDRFRGELRSRDAELDSLLRQASDRAVQ